MDLFLIVACLIGAWAFFSIIGNERQRRLQLLELELQRARQAAATQAQAQAPEIPTIG